MDMEITMLIVALFVAVLAVVFIASCVKVVPQQQAYVVERLGRYNETLGPGLHFIMPLVDRIAYQHSLKEIPLDVQPQQAITKDNSQVTIDGILYYQVTDPKQASYGTSDYELAIEQLAKTTLRSQIGTRELDRLLEERQTINKSVVSAIDEAATGWGVKVLRYEIKDIQPPKTVLDAMERQITAERNKRALIAESEGQRQKEINLASGSKQASIEKSEGERQAMINRAEGEAASILAVASANAEAIKRVGEAIRLQGGEAAVQLKIAEKYVEAFEELAKSSTSLIIPSNLSDLGSAVAASLQIFKKEGALPK